MKIKAFNSKRIQRSDTVYMRVSIKFQLGSFEDPDRAFQKLVNKPVGDIIHGAPKTILISQTKILAYGNWPARKEISITFEYPIEQAQWVPLRMRT